MKVRLRILILNSARKFIGEAAHCIALAEQLRAHGHGALLVARRNYELERHARERGISTEPLTFNSSFNPVLDFRDLMNLRRLVRREAPDVIHCHRGKDHWLAAQLRFVGLGSIPIVRTRHVVVPMREHILNRWLFSRATARVIAVSSKAAESLGSLGMKQGTHLRVIYSAVDICRFSPDHRNPGFRTQVGTPPDAPFVGLVARIQNIKGQRVFLQAAKLILAEFPECRFLVAGAGSEWKFTALRDAAREIGTEGQTVFRGWLENVEEAVASLDVGVIASLGSEGSSRVAYEYMASGVPVVATSVGCIPEIVRNGETGLVIPPNDPTALAEAVLRVLRDKSFARRMRDTALDHVRTHHTLERWISDVLEVYHAAVGKAPGPVRSGIHK